MIYEGQIDAGLKVFEAIRNRYDGYKRNPFNEGEYGHRYSRAMAAWAGILAYTGFQYSAVERSIAFNPRAGRYFWSNGYQYGIVEVKDNAESKTVKLSSLNGDLSLTSLALNGHGQIEFEGLKVFELGQEVEFEVKKNNEQAGLPVNARF